MKDSIDDVTPAEWDTLKRKATFHDHRAKSPEYKFGTRSLPDAVEQPSHYTGGEVECIDYIRQQLGDEFESYLEGNVLKYTHRYKVKGKPLEDLRKAQVYLGWLIEELENE
jgi:hypothetical protein